MTGSDFTYGDTLVAIQHITTKIRADERKFACVLAPVRGGLVPGVMISHKLGIPLFPLSYSLRDYRNIEDIPDSVFEYVTKSANKSVLLIDDIIDAGHTMAELVPKIKERIDGIDIVVSALITNNSQELITPHYTYKVIDRRVDDRFYTFFWEIE